MARDLSNDDLELAAEMQRFIAAATPNPAVYGVTPAELAALVTDANALEAAQNAEDAAQTAYRVAVKTTADARTPAEALFRQLRADAYATADDTQLIAAGLEPHKKPVKSDPTPPRNLRVEAGVDGVVALSWEAGDNTSTTQYVLYARDLPADAWQMFDVVPTLRAKQSGQTVGKTRYYQVTARRRGIESAPSNIAVAFGN